jgi:hypothetical protein
MNTTTISADTSSGMAAELLRDIQQRNYGVAETKARQLWNQLGREAQAMRKACDMIKVTLYETERKTRQQRVVAARMEARRLAAAEHMPTCETCVGRDAMWNVPPCRNCGDFTHYKRREEPDIFLMEMDYHIRNINQAQKTQHSEGMRAGFMYARAIYKGTRK